MSTIYLDTQSALDKNLEAIPGIPTIAWPLVPFDPVNEGVTEYVEPHWLPGSTDVASLGDSGQDISTGVYQVDVLVTAGAGTKRLNELCDLIADYFKPRQDLTYNGTSVQLTALSRNAPVTEGKFVRVALDIDYRQYTTQRA